VSVCIPAHNPKFLEPALWSAYNQSYSNIEVVIGDDSGGSEVKAVIDKFARESGIRNLTYVVSPVKNVTTNHVYCLLNARGDYIKMLNDDDLLEPNSVEVLLSLAVRFPFAGLYTSARVQIDASGSKMAQVGAFAPISKVPILMDGAHASRMALDRGNFIGEPNCTLFRRDIFMRDPFNFFKLGLQGSVPGTPGDLIAWLNLLCKGDLIYTPQVLSYLRVHSGSTSQRNSLTPEFGKQAWRRLRERAAWLGFGQMSSAGRPPRSLE
jgi:glycosyltransferase involved in cell wall biosynthesis